MELNGLVLMGGASSRMGKDKSLLTYNNNISQKEYMYHLLQNFCKEVFLGVSLLHKKTENGFKYIIDEKEQGGPMVGLISAFKQNSNMAWLICAIDMPFINYSAIDYLIKNRDTEKDCTCFLNEETNAPEPLVCIYETSFIKKLLNNELAGSISPKQNILNSNANLIHPTNKNWLTNVNTIEQYSIFKNKV